MFFLTILAGLAFSGQPQFLARLVIVIDDGIDIYTVFLLNHIFFIYFFLQLGPLPYGCRGILETANEFKCTVLYTICLLGSLTIT